MNDLFQYAIGFLAVVGPLTQIGALRAARRRIAALEAREAARDADVTAIAGELRDHRLSLPPPSVVPARSRLALSSPDWDDSARKTRVLPRQAPPLPAFDRPAYMSSDWVHPRQPD